MIDGRTKELFSPWDRMVGNPIQERISSFSEFREYVKLNNGVSRCVFVSVLPNSFVVDKIFLDFDGPLSFKTSSKLAIYLEGITDTFYPLFSGRKGFHIHIPVKPERATEKKLRHATLSLLKSADVFNQIGSAQSGRAIDSTTIGVLAQMARVPNTMRPPENKYWCTWLPKTFYTWTLQKIRIWSQRPHYYDNFGNNLLTLDQLINHDYETLQKELNEQLSEELDLEDVDFSYHSNSEELYQFFTPFMSNRIARSIAYSPNPPHKHRFIAAKALFESGFSKREVFEKFASCGWIDFSPSTTSYQLSKIDTARYVTKEDWVDVI